MTETKTYVIPDSSNNMISMLAPMLLSKGVDPGLLALMKNNNYGCEGGWFIWIIFLFFLMGWNRNGFGGFGGDNTAPLANMINNDSGRELLMSAIQGNGSSISQLASTLNCDINSVKTALNQVNSNLCQVGNQVGLSGQLVINAIQQGNMSIAELLSSCCCNVRNAITTQGYENQIATLNQTNQLSNEISNTKTAIATGFANTAYESLAQTCALQNTIKDTSSASTNAIIHKLDDMQTQALQDKIDALREKNSQLAVIINNGQQSALFGQMINSAVAPINSALTSLSKEVSDVQCKLPLTVTLPYSCATAIPTALAYNYGMYGINNINGWG